MKVAHCGDFLRFRAELCCIKRFVVKREFITPLKAKTWASEGKKRKKGVLNNTHAQGRPVADQRECIWKNWSCNELYFVSITITLTVLNSWNRTYKTLLKKPGKLYLVFISLRWSSYLVHRHMLVFHVLRNHLLCSLLNFLPQ